MGYNQNLGGEKPSFAKGLRVTLEDTPFVQNVTGAPILAADVDDYFAVNHIKNRKSVKVQGDNAPRLSVLQRARTEVPSLGIYPDYLQMFKWLWMTLQISNKTTVNGVDIYEFRKPRRGIPKTGTATLEAGTEDCADRAVGGAVQEFELSSGAEADPAMSVSLVAAEAVRGVAMTGAVARNHKFRVTAANVTAPTVLSIVAPGLAAKAVSLAIGNTVAQNIAAFAAQGLTVASSGTVNVASGEKHTLSGTGNALTIYGIDVFSKTIATLQTAIRALDAAHSTANISSDSAINQASNGTNLIAGKAATNNYGAANYLTDGSTSSSATSDFGSGADSLGFGKPFTGQTISRIRMFVISTSAAQGVFIKKNGVTSLQIDNAIPAGTANSWIELSGLNIAFSVNDTFAVNATSQAVTKISEVEVYEGAAIPASANLTINYDAAAGNIADLTFVGAGYSGASTQPGAAGGVIDFEFTTPANALVGVSKTSGDGYALSTTQAGSDGKVVPLPAFPFAASDWILNRNATLANIDAASLPGVVKYAFKVANCVMPRSTANGARTHTVVKKGTYDVTLDFTIDDDTTGARDGQVDAIIKEADEQTNKVSKPSWYQLFSQSDASHWLKIQSWMHVKSDLNSSADEDVNVYDIQLEENNYSPEEFSTRVLLAVPQGTFAI